MPVVTQLYQSKIASGELQPNQAQADAIQTLDRLPEKLTSVRPKRRASGLFGWLKTVLFGERPQQRARGIYLFGPVGRGKTLVMDLFVEAMEGQSPRVLRTHFHKFFAGVHRDIHERRRQGLSTEDVMSTLAQELAADQDVLAFDEFYVNNIADAMILGRFLDALFRHGVTLIFTSNDAPDALYSGGLQRERFVPTIELIRNQCDVVFVDAGMDYRLLQRRLPSTFSTPLGPASKRFLDACLSELTGDATPTSLTLYHQGTRLAVPQAAGGFARFSFAELCEQPLGRGEYLALAQEFRGILLGDVPQFNAENRDAAERFRILIDILYDQGRFLAMSAAVPIEKLPIVPEDHARLARTISRLFEMQSPGYVSDALA